MHTTILDQLCLNMLFHWYVTSALKSASLQFSSVAQSGTTLYNSIVCSTPGFLVHYQLPELAQTHVHQVSDTIQPSHPLLSPSPPAGGQGIGVSTSASVLPMNIQD